MRGPAVSIFYLEFLRFFCPVKNSHRSSRYSYVSPSLRLAIDQSDADNEKSKPTTNTTIAECLSPFGLTKKSKETAEFRRFLSMLRSDREQELGKDENLRGDVAKAWLEKTVFPAVHERFPHLPLASRVDDERGAAIKKLIGKDKQNKNQKKRKKGKKTHLQGMRLEARKQQSGAAFESKPDVENNTASLSHDFSLDDVSKRSSMSSSELEKKWNEWNCAIEISLVRRMQTPTEKSLARVMVADTRDHNKSISYELWLCALEQKFGIPSDEITQNYFMFSRTREQHWERILWDASFWHSIIVKKFHEGCIDLQIEIRETLSGK